jgi:hypothetical protein
MKNIFLFVLMTSLFFSCSEVEDDSRIDVIGENQIAPIAEFYQDIEETHPVGEGDTLKVAVYLRVPARSEATAIFKIDSDAKYGVDYSLFAVDKSDDETPKLDEVTFDATTNLLTVKLKSDLTDANRDYFYFGVKALSEDVTDGDMELDIELQSASTATQVYGIGADSEPDVLTVNLVDNDCFSDLAGTYDVVFSGALAGPDVMTITETANNKYLITNIDAGALGGANHGVSVACGSITGDAGTAFTITGDYSDDFTTINLTVKWGTYTWYIEMTKQ